MTTALGLGALCLSSFVQADEVEAEASEDNGPVVQMTKENFADTLNNNKFVLVKWYAPWCGHCKTMKQDYIQAAKDVDAATLEELGLEEGTGKPVLGEVDATVENDLASQYDVQGYPTVQWFVKGQKRLDYSGPRKAVEIVAWIKENVGPALKTVTQEELDTLKKDRKWSNALLVLTGDSADGKLMKVATAVAELPLIATQTVFLASGDKKKGITIYRGTEEEYKIQDEKKLALLDSANPEDGVDPAFKELSELITEERRPRFGQINEDNFELYMEHAKEGLFWVCLDPSKIEEGLSKYSNALVSAAEKQKYPFVWLDVSEFQEHAKQELGCTTYPTIVLQQGDLLGERGDAKVEKFVRSFSTKPEELESSSAVETFFADIESGKLEPVPEPDELDQLDDAEEEEAEDTSDLDEETDL